MEQEQRAWMRRREHGIGGEEVLPYMSSGVVFREMKPLRWAGWCGNEIMMLIPHDSPT